MSHHQQFPGFGLIDWFSMVRCKACFGKGNSFLGLLHALGHRSGARSYLAEKVHHGWFLLVESHAFKFRTNTNGMDHLSKSRVIACRWAKCAAAVLAPNRIES